jgi:5-(carboxyamino)imidazole ribonucleotide synthase
VADRTEVTGGSRSVGIVGAGQLARMLCEAASALDIRTVVLAEHPDDAAVGTADEVVVGVPSHAKALRLLAERCEVVTFDHELVELEILGALVADGVTLRPGVATLEMAVDKAEMRTRLSAAGVPVPAYRILDSPDPAAVADFAGTHGWPLVVKATRGGYDGRGVWTVADIDEATEVCRRADEAGTPLLVEELVAIEAELAVQVARRPGGETRSWPVVETAQVDGVCREVLVPGRLDPAMVAAAAELAGRVAEVAGSVGLLAVELFASPDGLVVNEVAARPHNSGHWTIEGAVTSQFENHLRAVLDLPLGATGTTAEQVASVNVFGSAEANDPGAALAGALSVDGAHVHLYGKGPRPGRKLGHVTVCGDDANDVRARAWAAARALGTPLPAGLVVPGSVEP